MKRAIDEARSKLPFEPFDIELVTGKILHVPHPEFVYVTPGRAEYFVWSTPDGVPIWWNATLVVSVKPSTRRRKRRRRAA